MSLTFAHHAHAGAAATDDKFLHRDLDAARIASRFAAQAQVYEDNALMQREAASRFDSWLAGLPCEEPRHIAEIGCGTGLMSRLLARRYPRSDLTVTDLAPEMVKYCRDQGILPPGVRYGVCDGRNIRFDPKPDWIVAAMCFQWFDPLMPVLRHHLSQCEMLAFSVVLDGSFSRWTEAHARACMNAGLRRLPDFDTLIRECRSLGVKQVYHHRTTIFTHHPDGLHFASQLRAIGASCPRVGHRPASLRPVLRQLSGGVEINHELGFFCLVK